MFVMVTITLDTISNTRQEMVFNCDACMLTMDRKDATMSWREAHFISRHLILL